MIEWEIIIILGFVIFFLLGIFFIGPIADIVRSKDQEKQPKPGSPSGFKEWKK
jgi:hypothetical protein